MARDSNTHTVRIIDAPVGGSALSILASSMSVGTWAPFTTTGLDAAVLVGGSTGNMLPYGNNGVWDPVHSIVSLVNQDHNGGGLRHVIYDEATNAWSYSGPVGIGGHGYDHLNIDPTTGDLYMWEYFYGAGGRIFRKPWGGAWNINYGTRNFHTNVASGVCIWTGPLTGFSDPKGVLIAMEGDFGAVMAKGVSALNGAGSFTLLADLSVTAPGYHLHGAYSRTKNVAVFGGGNAQPKRIWKVATTIAVTELVNAPSGCNIGTQAGSLTEDPVTGNFLIMTGGQLYELNPDGSGTYTQQTGNRVPPAAVNTLDTSSNSLVCIPISNYGVTMFVSADSGSSANVYLYKHAAYQPISLAWDASAGATSYKIYWGVVSGGYSSARSLNVGNVTSYSLPDPGADFRFFAITALSGAGESAISNEFTR